MGIRKSILNYIYDIRISIKDSETEILIPAQLWILAQSFVLAISAG